MQIRRILVPTDFSRQSLKALDYSISLAREHEAEVVLVHAIEPLPRGVGRWGNPAQLIENYRMDAMREMTRVEKYAIAQYPKCRSEIRFGTIEQVAVNSARALDADLLVIAVHSPAGMFANLFGGVAEKLMHHAPCPVVAVPDTTHDQPRQETFHASH